eukprot:752800-Hanusia_phi.AAC.2
MSLPPELGGPSDKFKKLKRSRTFGHQDAEVTMRKERRERQEGGEKDEDEDEIGLVQEAEACCRRRSSTDRSSSQQRCLGLRQPPLPRPPKSQALLSACATGGYKAPVPLPVSPLPPPPLAFAFSASEVHTLRCHVLSHDDIRETFEAFDVFGNGAITANALQVRRGRESPANMTGQAGDSQEIRPESHRSGSKGVDPSENPVRSSSSSSSSSDSPSLTCTQLADHTGEGAICFKDFTRLLYVRTRFVAPAA